MLFWDNGWESVRDGKIAQRTDRLALASALPKLPLVDDLPYLSASAADIVSNISTRRPGWTAVRVMEAYIRSSARSQETTNCLVSRRASPSWRQPLMLLQTEVMYTQALESARALDKEFDTTGKIRGELHGVPMSLKDVRVHGPLTRGQ
jgi:Asp-tRNA(Asn)/Glu-tRNA(Gln) amidotransferase A subunit family amidase